MQGIQGIRSHSRRAAAPSSSPADTRTDSSEQRFFDKLKMPLLSRRSTAEKSSRRECAVRAFCPRQNLGAGAAPPPRALKSRRAERALGPRSPQKRTRLTSCPFWGKGRSKWIFGVNRTVAGKPPDGPSGPRRECAVRAFCPRQNLGAGAAPPPRALKSRRAERALGPRSPQKRTRLTSCPFLWCARRESNPHALASTGT